MVGQDVGNDNDIEDYNSKYFIIGGEQGKDELWLQCFVFKYWLMLILLIGI